MKHITAFLTTNTRHYCANVVVAALKSCNEKRWFCTEELIDSIHSECEWASHWDVTCAFLLSNLCNCAKCTCFARCRESCKYKWTGCWKRRTRWFSCAFNYLPYGTAGHLWLGWGHYCWPDRITPPWVAHCVDGQSSRVYADVIGTLMCCAGKTILYTANILPIL